MACRCKPCRALKRKERYDVRRMRGVAEWKADVEEQWQPRRRSR